MTIIVILYIANLGLNTLFDHVYQHNRWIPDLFNRLALEDLSDSEMKLIHQQKLIKIIFNSFVPIRCQDGLEKNWSGGQIKKIMSISSRILEVVLEIFPDYTFLINFLQLLIAFKKFYEAMCGKSLIQGWEDYAFQFLRSLKSFLSESVSLGYIQFHMIYHSINICAKYGVGLGALGIDQGIESLHSHVFYNLLPNIKKSRMPAPSETLTEENPPTEGYINKFMDIQGVQLETALSPIKLKRVTFDHCDYLKTLEIDASIIKNFDEQAHGHALLVTLSKAQAKKIQNLKPPADPKKS